MPSYYEIRNQVYKDIDDWLNQAKQENLLFKAKDLIRELIYKYPYGERGMRKHIQQHYEDDLKMRWDTVTDEIWWDTNDRKQREE